MKKTIIYIIAIGILLFITIKNPGLGILLTLGAIVYTLWKNRCKITTYRASQAYYIKGDANKAQTLYNKAYATGNMKPEEKISFSSFCLREGNFDKAKRLLNEIINSSRTTKEDKINAKHNMSVVLWREGNLDGAVEMITEVKEKAPSTNVYGTMGVLLLDKARRGNPEEYLEFMQEAYGYNSDDKTIADNLAELYYLLGRDADAREVYEKLNWGRIFSPMPYYNYAKVMIRTGDTEKARELLEKALTLKFTSVMTVSREMVERTLAAIG